MISTTMLKHHWERALTYESYVATGSPDQRASWAAFHSKVRLTPEQCDVLGGFSRRLKVLVVSGMWCGDCVQQVPMFDHIQRAQPEWISLRIGDREVHEELSDAVKICGGRRVPTVVFLNEDDEFIGLYGDQVLSRFRAKAARSLGAHCPLPGAEVPADEVAATLADWLREFERAHLLVRLSAKLRERHGD
ncbi:MAG: thioredoxin family protein [Phycisphaerales bacterium]